MKTEAARLAARTAILRPRSTGRLWTAEFKRRLCRGLDHGIVTETEVMAAHDMGHEELAGYRRKYGRVAA